MKRKLKIKFNSPVILTFVALCLVIMLANLITGGKSNEAAFMTYRSSFASPMTYIRLFTHVLGHADWVHLVGNMAYILLLGPLLEEKYGSKRLLLIIVITALITGVINFALFPNVALCGASGVCFAFILLSSFTSFKDGEIPLTFILVAVIYLGQQIYEGIVLEDNISNLSHILGGIVGAVCGFFMNKKLMQK